MFASRASAERPLTSRDPISSFVAVPIHPSWLLRDLRWVLAVGGLYAAAVIAAVLCLHPYFSQTWDVGTFAAAGRSFLGGSDWASLYAQTRAGQRWPFAYPPLHAAAVAPLLLLASLLPDWLLVRLPPLLADLGVGLLIYVLVARRTRARGLARAGFVLFLLNPVTFYDTAVQGHFEAEWLFFILLAYLLRDSNRGLLWPSLALALAFLFKQVAILFTLPYWFSLLLAARGTGLERIGRAAASVLVWVIPIGLVSLPFLLYSGDYVYMNLQYVASVPLQTQSWLVALAGLFGGQLWPLSHSTLPVAAAAVLISFFALRQGASLYRAAALVAIAFFLLSQKVMGYYYVMLLPFALIELLPARRYGLLLLIVAATAWISLSPYFAPWTAAPHWPVYAALGVLNSLFWLAAAISIDRGSARAPADDPPRPASPELVALVIFSVLLFGEAVAAAVVQPLVNSPISPIRAPLIAPGLWGQTLGAWAAALALVLAAAVVLWWMARARAAFSAPPRFAFILALVYLPLYFLTFALTKESTAALEWLLNSLGF